MTPINPIPEVDLPERMSSAYWAYGKRGPYAALTHRCLWKECGITDVMVDFRGAYSEICGADHDEKGEIIHVWFESRESLDRYLMLTDDIIIDTIIGYDDSTDMREIYDRRG